MMDAMTTGSLTWDEMVAIEPRLLEVAALAKRLQRRQRRRTQNWEHYELWRNMLRQYVGWNSYRRELASNECYDTAHRHLLAVWETGSDT